MLFPNQTINRDSDEKNPLSYIPNEVEQPKISNPINCDPKGKGFFFEILLRLLFLLFRYFN